MISFSAIKYDRFKPICSCCKYSLTAKLVVKAIRIGAINLDLDFSSNHFQGEFVLPYEVLESETLTSLSLCDCVISLDADRKLRCWRLKSLSLRNVCLDGNMIWDILLGCPLIEKLVIYECTFVNEFVNEFQTCDAVWMLSLRPPVNPYEFQRLKCLQLEKVHINTLFFRDLSSKFPCLKDLIINNCSGFEEIAVSSHSLENICFKLSSGMLRATFDVPRIRNLYFVGSCLSSLTFETVSQDFNCHISVSYNKHSPSWFTDLKKLLRNLTLSSRIYLHISTCADLSENSGDYACDDQGLPTRIVEHLMLSIKAASLVPCAFLYSLLQSCHPKFLALDLSNCCTTSAWKAHCDFVKLLRKTLMPEASENCPIPNRLYPCFRHLKKVNIKSFKNGKCQLLPLKTLLADSTIPSNIESLHFQFRWEPID